MGRPFNPPPLPTRKPPGNPQLEAGTSSTLPTIPTSHPTRNPSADSPTPTRPQISRLFSPLPSHRTSTRVRTRSRILSAARRRRNFLASLVAPEGGENPTAPTEPASHIPTSTPTTTGANPTPATTTSLPIPLLLNRAATTLPSLDIVSQTPSPPPFSGHSAPLRRSAAPPLDTARLPTGRDRHAVPRRALRAAVVAAAMEQVPTTRRTPHVIHLPRRVSDTSDSSDPEYANPTTPARESPSTPRTPSSGTGSPDAGRDVEALSPPARGGLSRRRAELPSERIAAELATLPTPPPSPPVRRASTPPPSERASAALTSLSSMQEMCITFLIAQNCRWREWLLRERRSVQCVATRTVSQGRANGDERRRTETYAVFCNRYFDVLLRENDVLFDRLRRQLTRLQQGGFAPSTAREADGLLDRELGRGDAEVAEGDTLAGGLGRRAGETGSGRGLRAWGMEEDMTGVRNPQAWRRRADMRGRRTLSTRRRFFGEHGGYIPRSSRTGGERARWEDEGMTQAREASRQEGEEQESGRRISMSPSTDEMEEMLRLAGVPASELPSNNRAVRLPTFMPVPTANASDSPTGERREFQQGSANDGEDSGLEEEMLQRRQEQRLCRLHEAFSRIRTLQHRSNTLMEMIQDTAAQSRAAAEEFSTVSNTYLQLVYNGVSGRDFVEGETEDADVFAAPAAASSWLRDPCPDGDGNGESVGDT